MSTRLTTAKGKSYQFEDHQGWTICAVRRHPKAWHGFARPPGNPHGKYTLTVGPLPDREAALDAIRAAVDEERENHALDALVVLALRGEVAVDIIDLDNLPELSPEETAALEAIDINSIIAKAKEVSCP